LTSRLTYDDLFSIHKDFWANKRYIENRQECTVAERVKVIEDGRRGLSDFPLVDGSPVEDGMLLSPSMLSPSILHSAKLNIAGTGPEICGELFQVIWPYHKLLWLPAIVGCKLKVTTVAETIWPVKVLDKEWYRGEPPEIQVNEEWFEKLLEFTRYLVDHFHPHYLVVQDMISRGPGDLLGNMMGSDNLSIGMYTHPKEIKRLLDSLADIFIEVVSAQFDLIPEFEGGYGNIYGIWAPGRSIRIQEDMAINLSPKLVKEFLLPADQKILNSFDYAVFHTHSGGVRLSEMISDLDGRLAVEVSMDPQGPPLRELLPIFGRIKEKKPMVICGDFTVEDRGLIASEMSGRGCLLDVSLAMPVPVE